MSKYLQRRQIDGHSYEFREARENPADAPTLNPEIIKIEIAKLELKPGDKLLLRFTPNPRLVSPTVEDFQRWKTFFEGFAPGVEIAVVDASLDLTILRQAEASKTYA